MGNHELEVIFSKTTEADVEFAERICSYVGQADLRSKLNDNVAVIVVSDMATSDPQWQERVRNIAPDVRLIPVGMLENVDYSDSEIIPQKIEELNFIRDDEYCLDNIADSMVLDSSFYEAKSAVLVNLGAWLVSKKSDAFLISDRRKVKQLRINLGKNGYSSHDTYFQDQMTSIDDYLLKSSKYAHKLLLANVRRHLGNTVLGMMAAMVVVVIAIVAPNLVRAANETALLAVDDDQQRAPYNLVKILDGINNPFIDNEIRLRFLSETESYLDMNWYNAPLGLNYKHNQTDAFLINDRYTMTSTDTGKLFTWDNRNGTLCSEGMLFKDERSLLAIDSLELDQGSVFTAVDENFSVYFECDHQWVNSDRPYPFSGASPIRIDSDGDGIVVYDDKFLIYNELNIDGMPVQKGYLAENAYDGMDYRINCAEVTDGWFRAAVTVDGIMQVEDRTLDGGAEWIRYDTEIAADPDCLAAIKKGRLVFADSEGYLQLWDIQNPNAAPEPLGLRLPDPQSIAFADESTIVYHDSALGTRLYDIDRRIDLGEVLAATDNASRLSAIPTTVMCFSDNIYYTQPISTMLPHEKIDDSTAMHVFRGTSQTSNGQVRKAAVENGHILHIEMDVDGQTLNLAVDCQNYNHVGNAIASAEMMNGIENAQHFIVNPINCTGQPTTIGIIDDGYGIVVGCADGSFTELVFKPNGSFMKKATRKLPNGSPIVCIYEMSDRYYLQDEAGNYWYARLGWPGTEDGAYLLDSINDKMNIGMTQELLDSISKSTADSLNFDLAAGGDGKEWE